MKCYRGYEVQPLKTPSGLWYMGTVNEEGLPNCRISTGYAKTKEAAKELPLDRQDVMENVFCNGYGHCFPD